jgi:hypothetical protein
MPLSDRAAVALVDWMCQVFVELLLRSSRGVLRPAELVDRQACRDNARNCCSAGVSPALSLSSSSHPGGLSQYCSICLDILSSMGLDDLIWRACQLDS